MIISYCATLKGFLFNFSKQKVDDLINIKNSNLSSSNNIHSLVAWYLLRYILSKMIIRWVLIFVSIMFTLKNILKLD